MNWRATWVSIGSDRTVHAPSWDPALKQQNKGKQNETNKTPAKKKNKTNKLAQAGMNIFNNNI